MSDHPNLLPFSSQPPARDAQQEALLQRLFARIGEVSTLPTAAAHIVQVVSDDRSGASDLLRVVESDPALAVRIVRAVNSSYYSLRNRVTNLRSAITLLGFREVRNLALTIYVSRLFRASPGYRTYSRQGLWDHLVGVATASRLLASVSGRVAPDEAYLAGLLHDLGYLLIDQQIQSRFRQIVDTLDEDTPTHRIEWRILSFDHSELGAYVANKWRFPEGVLDAIRFHHSADVYAGEHRRLVATVALADYLCSRKGLTSLGVCNVAPLPNAVFEALEIQRWQLPLVWERLEDALGRMGELVAVG